MQEGTAPLHPLTGPQPGGQPLGPLQTPHVRGTGSVNNLDPRLYSGWIYAWAGRI